MGKNRGVKNDGIANRRLVNTGDTDGHKNFLTGHNWFGFVHYCSTMRIVFEKST